MTQIKSKQRVADHGEVFTAEREVKAMLDLVSNEAMRIASRFLEPACGNGNFLVEILDRKLSTIKGESISKRSEYERITFLAVSTLYGIDILHDNVRACRERLFQTFDNHYTRLFGSHSSNCYRNSIRYVIENNIIHGNTLKTESIFFSEWVLGKREKGSEAYAYNFIHPHEHKGLNSMQFDVIIGNPPYQLSDEGHGKSAMPIYHKFVRQAKALNPRYLIMIIPSRWFAGGKGLDEFRKEMLNDSRMKTLVDFLDARDCFPNVDIAGGVCYFLWDREHLGACEITHRHKDIMTTSVRQLNEFEIFVRSAEAAQIIKKIQKIHEPDMSTQVSGRNPFGLSTRERPSGNGTLTLLCSEGEGKIEEERVISGKKYIGQWKVITSNASYDHGGLPDKEGKRRVLSRVEVLPPSFVCTDSYIIVGSFPDKIQAKNLAEYIKTKFVRFLISQRQASQHITKGRFAFVPQQDHTQKWTDEKLYKKYSLSNEEIEFIESLFSSPYAKSSHP